MITNTSDEDTTNFIIFYFSHVDTIQPCLNSKEWQWLRNPVAVVAHSVFIQGTLFNIQIVKVTYS
jgi:uncharacterized protein (DUF1330 family)